MSSFNLVLSKHVQMSQVQMVRFLISLVYVFVCLFQTRKRNGTRSKNTCIRNYETSVERIMGLSSR